MAMKRKIYEAKEPKSMCKCGHTGDGPGSSHAGIGPAAGHGYCTVIGCSCGKFTWACFLPYGKRLMDRARRERAKEVG